MGNLLCIGGPLDRKHHDALYTNFQYDEVPPPKLREGPQATQTNEVKRHTYYFDGISAPDRSINFWRHESLTSTQAIARLFEVYAAKEMNVVSVEEEYRVYEGMNNVTSIDRLKRHVSARLFHSVQIWDCVDVATHYYDDKVRITAQVLVAKPRFGG